MKFIVGKKQVLVFGGFFFLIHCILAMAFYRERLFTDSAYYFLYTVNNGWFKVGHQRFVLVIAEILPLFGSYIGLPLKTLMILYSLDHVFFFLTLFLIPIRRNDLNGALAIIALLGFTTLNLYVNPMLEIWYGAGFAILLYSFLQKDVLTKKDYGLIAILEITVLFSHPENSILVILLILLDMEKRKAFTRIHFTMFIIFIGTGLFKLITLDIYEKNKLSSDFTAINNHQYSNLLHRDYMNDLGALFIHHYWILLLLLAVCCIKYAVSGRYLRVGIVFITFAGTIGLVNSVDSNNIFSHYSAVMYMPLVSIAVIPFFYDVFGTMVVISKAIVFAIFILLICLRLYCQVDAISIYTERVNQMERVINVADEIGGNKFFTNSKNFKQANSTAKWGYPMETLLLSAERGKEKCRSVVTEEDTEDVKARVIFTDNTVFMLRRWDIIPDSKLNPKYFFAQKGIYKNLNFKE